MADFEGRVALVTGGGSGLGAAISKDLATHGAKVVVTDINLESARRVVDEIRRSDGEATPLAQDASKATEARAAVEFCVETYGGLHHAVNKPGSPRRECPRARSTRQRGTGSSP